MRISDIFNHEHKRKDRDMSAQNQNSSFYLNDICKWRPVDYYDPECVRQFLKNAEQLMTEKIRIMELDEYNVSFFDKYIDDLISIALQNVAEQRIGHQRALQEIRAGQLSQREIYTEELARIEKELQTLEE